MSRSPVSSQASERVPMAEQRLAQTTAESAQEEEERQGMEDEEDDEDDQDRILEVYLGWQKLNQQVTRDVPGIDAAFLAMDTDDGVEVVWNEVIYSQNRRTGKSRDRLKKILQGLTEMKHQNIVTFHDFWHDKVGQQERLVFITEYITSGSLLQFLNKTKKTKKIVAVSDKIWRRWCRQILSALSYLHRNDITHGNLSLASIFIQHNGLVKIGSVSPDAIHTHVKTKQEVLKGLHYFAPEYTEGPITTHADIYSFGVCALEMLNLDLLDNGENFLALKDSIGKYVDALEPHKKQFVKLCLREDPKARPKANALLKHPVLQEVFSLKLLSVFVLRERKNEIELKMDSLQFGDRPAESVLAFIPSKGGKPVQKVASEVCQIDIEKIFDDISQDLLLEPSVTTPKKSEPGTSSTHPASELSKDKTTPTYDRETRKVSFMVCEVRPITAENKCELWLKFNFDNKLERELSTELGAADNAPDLASSLVEYGLVSEEDREKVVELINEKLRTMNSLLSTDNNNSFAET